MNILFKENINRSINLKSVSKIAMQKTMIDVNVHGLFK